MPEYNLLYQEINRSVKKSYTNCFSAFPELGNQEIIIWIVETDELLKHCNKLEPMLSNDEKYKSKAFHFKADSDRYICAHGMLRLILAHYTNSCPVSLKLTSGFYGKPGLADFDDIKFNLSHTKDLIAFAVTRYREIGIDIEKYIPLENIDDLSRSIMHEDELLDYFSLPVFKRHDYFYRCWVKKESIVKAWGVGLYIDLRQVKVINQNIPYISPKQIIEKHNLKKEWHILIFDSPCRHFGAVCFEGEESCARINIIDRLATCLRCGGHF